MTAGKHLYYRGSLRSCNYTCGYCPFSKGNMGEERLERDQEQLGKLVQWLKESGQGIESLQIVPYGEALIHTYYWEAMAEISRLPFIQAVGCQTNGSFPADRMLRLYEQAGGCLRKLRLWCTFHPTMTTPSAFLSRCRQLLQWGIAFCAGAVGDPEQLKAIRELRDGLPASVYVWINRMEGLKRPYTKDERERLSAVDPFFYLEEKHWKANPENCTGGRGQSFFADAAGGLKACNVSRKRTGNLYGGIETAAGRQSLCGAGECSCYLAYCSRLDMKERIFFEPYPAFRIPRRPAAAFFDVDGTLTEGKTGVIKEGTVEKIRRFSRHCAIYLATSLPYTDAMHRCAAIRPYLSGGVFANGGMIVYRRDKKIRRCFPIAPGVAAGITEAAEKYAIAARLYQEEGRIYKITAFCEKTNRHYRAFWKEIKGWIRECQSIEENGHIQITAQGADKKNGVLLICREKGYEKESVLVAGNSGTDLPMLEYFPLSIRRD